MKPETLADAWVDFAGNEMPVDCQLQYNAMQVSFYVGAAAIYSIAMQARKLDAPEARKKMTALFDELDFFMQSLPHLDPHGVGTTKGNA